jgi:hypothetical protein
MTKIRPVFVMLTWALAVGVCHVAALGQTTTAPRAASAPAAVAKSPDVPTTVPAGPASAGDIFVPLSIAPVEPNGYALVPAPLKPWLPPAGGIDQPRVLPSELAHALTTRPAGGLSAMPVLPADLTAPAKLAITYPLAWSVLPDPAGIGPITPRARGDRARPDALTDPTPELSAQLMTQPLGILRATSAPFVRLSIPDPFETVNAVKFRNPPPDLDQPATIPDWPELPKFVVPE